MNDRTASGFMLSAALHGLVAALLLFGYFLGDQEAKKLPRVLELVAGEGDNYAATEAPALGSPDSVKVTVPEIAGPPVPIPSMPVIAEPEPTPPSPVQPAPVPPAPEPVVERAPEPKKTVTTAKTTEAKAAPEEKIRDFSKDVARISRKRQARLEAKYKAQREAEERRAKEEALKAKRMTKAEFDAQNRRETAARTAGGTGAKVTHIDTEGIAKGVVGGSTRNKTGGAGGKALTREEGDELDAYFAYLKRRLHEALDKPPGLSDTLVAVAEMRIAADGTLSGARIVRSSGSTEFDQASLEAIARVRSIGPRPDGKSETIRLSFKMKEEEED